MKTDPLRAALEDALADNPDDLASHAAYADYLSEQGDPRGEFVRVQLALEDESLSPAQRDALRRRERELLDAHERGWLGELGPLLLGTPEEQRALFDAEWDATNPQASLHSQYLPERVRFRHGWRRGWLDRFECDALGVEM